MSIEDTYAGVVVGGFGGGEGPRILDLSEAGVGHCGGEGRECVEEISKS